MTDPQSYGGAADQYLNRGVLAPWDTLMHSLDGRLTIERELGRGGTAVVYLAREADAGRLVALKVLRQELAAAVGVPRFLREIEIEGRLNHPHILPIYESGSFDGRPFYTMPYVEGETLRERVRRERQLPTDLALSIARDVASALDHAHSHGVVHRDVKPANILLANDGRVFLADFGIARAMTVSTGDKLTDSGIFVGTPEYMSPEQADVHPKLDGRSDVYSLGCVVYEMLGGEPPFTGPTAAAIVARHCQEAPRSLGVIRPSLGSPVQRVIERALAKVPADRYATASEMVDALTAAVALGPVRETPRIRIGVWFGLATALMIAVAAPLFFSLHGRDELDSNRIVVFPLRDPGASSGPNGESIATYIGYALEGTRPLTWREGWTLLTSEERSRVNELMPGRARGVSRSAHAGFFIDGSIVRSGDSTTIGLELHSVAGDSVVSRKSAAGTGAVPAIALRAVAALLPSLLAPGRDVDLSALEQINPTAVANFLQGEREYRRMQFAGAVQHYHEALRDDSSFALAALRGAEAANWLGHFGEDTAFASVALRRETRLPRVRALVARGLYAYLTGSADTAISNLRRALVIDSGSAPVWTLLGEVYLRILPSSGPADSVARDALERARRADTDFAPALLLLEETALREGRTQDALGLREELRRAGADTTHLSLRDLMFRCVRDGPRSIDWLEAAHRDLRAVQQTGKVLSPHASQAACAASAFKAALQADTSARVRWGAILGLQSVMVAVGQDRSIPALLSSRRSADLPVWMLYALDVMAGVNVSDEASIAVERRGANYPAMTTTHLYVLAAWAAYQGDRERLRIIERELRHKADSSQSRRDSLLVRAIDARIPLVEGDTTKSLRLLEALAPTAPRSDIAWQPWEALGSERLLLAQILYARRRFDDAIRVAGLLDATEPIAYLLYLRPSLTLRAKAAREAGRNAQATVLERRLDKLGTQAHEVLAVPPEPTR